MIFNRKNKSNKVKSLQPESTPSEGKQWPDTDPPGPNSLLVISDGRTQYKKEEVSPGRWQWMVDKEVKAHFRQDEVKRSTLWNALQTRVLTDEEMLEVGRQGKSLNIEMGVVYYASEKLQELTNALLIQQILRQK